MLLLVAGLKTFCVKTCTATGMTTGLATFTTTHRVIDRVHYDTAVVRTTTEPTAAASLTRLFESVVGVADNADSSAASKEHFASFT